MPNESNNSGSSRDVASAYLAMMTLWVVPVIAWPVRGSMISFWDVTLVIGRPLISIRSRGQAAPKRKLRPRHCG
jgi:hypothetical protein